MSSYVTSDQTQIHNFIIAVSTISDADEVPLTPNSKHSGGAYNVVDTYAESGSPAPSCFSVQEHNNASGSSHRAPTLEDRRLLDRLIGRSVDDDQDQSETVSPKVINFFSKHYSAHHMYNIFRPRMGIPGLQRLLARTLSAMCSTTWKRFVNANECATLPHVGRLRNQKGGKLSFFYCVKNQR